MKKVMLFLSLMIVLSCKPQKISKTIIPTVDNKFEKITRIINESRTDEIIDNKHIIYTSASSGFDVVYYGKDKYFSVVKNYYPSKNIQNKGAEFNEGSQVGIWYYFDESGKLVKEENTDEGYDFTPEKVVRYCEKNKIELPKGYHESGFYTQVRKETLNGQRVWVIKYQDPAKPAYTNYSKNGYEYEIVLFETVILDGQTGKVLKIIPSDNFKSD